MKWLVLLFLVVLAKSLNGYQNPEGNGENQNRDNHKIEKMSILKVNPRLVVMEWVEKAQRVPPPVIERGDCGGPRFHEVYDRAVAIWGQGINYVIYDQGLAAGQNLINDVEKRYNDLVNCIGQSSDTDPERNNAERDLKYLVEQLETLLELKPGNQTVKHKPLPELPEQQTRIVSQTKNRTACDFFLNLPEFVNDDLSVGYGYIAGVFLRGWRNSRKYLEIQQLQYRNQILNNGVLPVYRKVVEKVFKNRDYIERLVTKDTWSSFENSGNLIIKLSNEWLQALAELEQQENSS